MIIEIIIAIILYFVIGCLVAAFVIWYEYPLHPIDKEFLAVAIPILWPIVLPLFILTKVFILLCALPIMIINRLLKLEGIKNTDEKELP